MSKIIVICYVVGYPHSWSIYSEQALWRADSQAQCYNVAAQRYSSYGISARTIELGTKRDDMLFVSECGIEGKDCKDISKEVKNHAQP